MSLGEEEARRRLAAIKAKKTGVGRSIIALDPGTRETGVAVLKNGVVEVCDVIRNIRGSSAKDRLPEMCRRVTQCLTTLYKEFEPDTVAFEWQMIREDDPRPNDILHLSIVLGAAMGVDRGIFTKLLLPLPVQWKGSVQAATFERFQRESAIGQAALDAMDERGVPHGVQHNGLDAALLAAWAINQRLPWAV